MRDHNETASKIRDYVNRQTFPVSIPAVAEHLGVSHDSATNTASYQITLGAWRRAEDGRVMGANCRLPLDWTEDINHHMDPSLLETCMSQHDLIDIWRTGVWLSTAEIHELTGIPSDKIKNAFNRGKLQYKMILGSRHATYESVLAWANSINQPQCKRKRIGVV